MLCSSQNSNLSLLYTVTLHMISVSCLEMVCKAAIMIFKINTYLSFVLFHNSFQVVNSFSRVQQLVSSHFFQILAERPVWTCWQLAHWLRPKVWGIVQWKITVRMMLFNLKTRWFLFSNFVEYKMRVYRIVQVVYEWAAKVKPTLTLKDSWEVVVDRRLEVERLSDLKDDHDLQH